MWLAGRGDGGARTVQVASSASAVSGCASAVRGRHLRRGLRWLSVASGGWSAFLGLAPSAAARPVLPLRAAQGLKSIEITSRADSNGGRPIAVDLVYAAAKAPATALSTMQASAYFARHDQLVLDYPQTFRSQRWEIQAGQHVLQAKCRHPAI